MQAIEFEAKIQNGLIHLPPVYQHWQDGGRVKVIVLVDEEAKLPSPIKMRQAGCLKNQIVMRDDFDAPMNETELALWCNAPLFPGN